MTSPLWPPPTPTVMTDKKFSGVPSPFTSSPLHRNGPFGETAPKTSHQNGSPDQGLEHQSSRNISPVLQVLSAPNGRTSDPTSPIRNLGGLVSSVQGSGPEGRSSLPRPRGRSLGSALSVRTRTTATRSKHRSSQQQDEPEALLDLILESQGQRLNDQRASVSLLPDPGAAGLCETCNHDKPHASTLDFYNMLIHYQSDRMEEQRCSLPDLDDAVGSVLEGQEDFFSLIQRVQSRRMDEQRASLLMSHTEDDDDDDDTHSGISPVHH